MVSNGIMFVPYFVKICHLVQKLKGEFRQHGDLICLNFSLRKESRLKMEFETYYISYVC
jgi:hypothetical protein